MRFSVIASGLLAALSFVSATPIELVEKDNVTIVEEVVVYADCNKIKPKVFIISMVSNLSKSYQVSRRH